MRRAKAAAVTTERNLDAPARELLLDAIAEPPRRPSPSPPPTPRAADRSREALQRWLEEEM